MPKKGKKTSKGNKNKESTKCSPNLESTTKIQEPSESGILEAESMKTDNEILRKTEENQMLKDKIGEQQETIQRFLEEAQSKDKFNEELNKKNHFLSGKLDELNEHVEQLQRAVENYQQEFEETEMELLQMRNERKNLMKELEMERFEKEQALISSNGADATSRVLELERKIVDVEVESSEKISEYVEEIENKKANIENLEKRLKISLMENNIMKDEIEHWKSNYNDISAELDECVEKLSSYELLEEVKAREAKIDHINSETNMANMSKQLKELKKEKEEALKLAEFYENELNTKDAIRLENKIVNGHEYTSINVDEYIPESSFTEAALPAFYSSYAEEFKRKLRRIQRQSNFPIFSMLKLLFICYFVLLNVCALRYLSPET